MPSRVVPESLLDSDQWHALSDKAARLYIANWLIADDFGLLLLTPLNVARRAYKNRPSDDAFEKLVSELVEQDLLRIYWSDEEKPARFGFLPRFRQKLKQMKARHPLPPPELYADDLDAAEKFQANKAKFEKLPPGRLQVGSKSAPEVKRREEKRFSSSSSSSSSSRSDAPAAAEPERRSASITERPREKEEPNRTKTVDDYAVELGLQRQPGESDTALMARVLDARKVAHG